MYLLFVDESGKPDERAFAVGGVIVRADEWPLLRDRWLAALDAHGWPADKELKWHGTRTGEVPPALADEVFAATAGSPVTCLVVILKPLAAKQRRPDLFGSPEDVYTQALMWLAEHARDLAHPPLACGAPVELDRFRVVGSGLDGGCAGGGRAAAFSSPPPARRGVVGGLPPGSN